MKKIVLAKLRSFINGWGYDVIPYSQYPPDFSQQNIQICEIVKPYTLTNPESVNALIDAVRYIVQNNVNGVMVECGVWRGGSTMAMALTLKNLGVERDLYLYDTFSGMSPPSEADISFLGEKAQDVYSKSSISDGKSAWCYCSLEEVKRNVFSTGYGQEKFHFIQGKVEETIPKNLPKEISLLRLDTDWYESTKHELTHLFPLLEKNGVLIVDDYGHWEGAKTAVDEYFKEKNIRILLNRIDYTGRIGIKT